MAARKRTTTARTSKKIIPIELCQQDEKLPVKYVITVFYYRPRPIPDDLRDEMFHEGSWLTPERVEGIALDSKQARYYWTPSTLKRARDATFGLEVAATYTLEEPDIAFTLLNKLMHKKDGIQKTLPGAMAVQFSRVYRDGYRLTRRYQWGKIAGREARRWCRVEKFSGTATEEEGIVTAEAPTLALIA